MYIIRHGYNEDNHGLRNVLDNPMRPDRRTNPKYDEQRRTTNNNINIHRARNHVWAIYDIDTDFPSRFVGCGT